VNELDLERNLHMWIFLKKNDEQDVDYLDIDNMNVMK